MKDINDFRYSITNWDESVYETDDIEEARIAVRDGKEVYKMTRWLFESGPVLVRLFVTLKLNYHRLKPVG